MKSLEFLHGSSFGYNFYKGLLISPAISALGTLLSFNLLRFVSSIYANRHNALAPNLTNKNPIQYYPTSNRQPKLHPITTLPVHAPSKNWQKKARRIGRANLMDKQNNVKTD